MCLTLSEAVRFDIFARAALKMSQTNKQQRVCKIQCAIAASKMLQTKQTVEAVQTLNLQELLSKCCKQTNSRGCAKLNLQELLSKCCKSNKQQRLCKLNLQDLLSKCCKQTGCKQINKQWRVCETQFAQTLSKINLLSESEHTLF